VSAAATFSPNRFRWSLQEVATAGADSREATRSCDRPGTAPGASPMRLRSYTVWHCVVQSPPPADAGSD
jgi:hypothetical protein